MELSTRSKGSRNGGIVMLKVLYKKMKVKHPDVLAEDEGQYGNGDSQSKVGEAIAMMVQAVFLEKRK